MGIPVSDPQPKVPVVRTAEFTLSLEQATATETFLHCDIHVRWSPAVKRQLATAFEQLLRLHGGPLRALHKPGDRKHLKFLTMYGFRKIAEYHDALHGSQEIFST